MEKIFRMSDIEIITVFIDRDEQLGENSCSIFLIALYRTI